MELAIWKLCRYRIFSLLVVGNMIAYMNRLAINFALLSMSPKNKINKNGTCFNNSVLVQTMRMGFQTSTWNSFADWLIHQTSISATWPIRLTFRKLPEPLKRLILQNLTDCSKKVSIWQFQKISIIQKRKDRLEIFFTLNDHREDAPYFSDPQVAIF